MDDPFITIIIAAKNAQETLKKCLDSVLASDYKNFEVIAVDDGSTDRTAEIMREYSSRVKVITNGRSRGAAQARNIAAAAAKGQYLAFTDSDCTVDKSWLKELLSCFNDPAIAAVGGCQAIPADETEFGKIVSMFFNSIGFAAEYLRQPQSQAVFVEHNPTCNAMYKKEIYLQEGGFLKGLFPGEDVEFDYRLRKKGYKLLFNSNSVVYHYRSRDLKNFSRKMFRYGWVQGILVKKYGFFRKFQYFFISSLALFFLLFSTFYFNIKAGLLLFLVLISILWIYFLVFSRKFYLAFYFLWNFAVLIFFWNTGFIGGVINPALKKQEE